MESFVERRRSEPWPEVMRLRAQVATLTASNRDLAKAIADLTDECPDWAPTLGNVYWLWSQARNSLPGWKLIWQRVVHLVDDLGGLQAPKLTPLVWDQFRARRRLTTTHRHGPPCEATLNIELTYAKAMLNWAVEHGLLKRNPLQRAKPVKTDNARETRLRPEDVERLLAAADDVVDRRLPEGEDDGARAALLKAFVLAIFDSMLRFGEARHLRLARIRSDGSYELLASETKGKRPRLVKLTARTLQAFRAIKRGPHAVYVFEMDGQIVKDERMRDWFRRACELSGVDSVATPRDKRVRPHDARAGGATAADEAGARPRAIQRVLGHRSLQTTQIYLRSDPRMDADHVAEKITEKLTKDARRAGPHRAPRKKTKRAQQKI